VKEKDQNQIRGPTIATNKQEKKKLLRDCFNSNPKINNKREITEENAYYALCIH